MNRTSRRIVSASLALLALIILPAKADTPAAAAPIDPALAADIETVIIRYRAYFLEPDYPDVDKIQQSQLPDGSWADLHYDDHLRDKNWSPGTHLDRVKRMAAVYAKKGNPFYHSPKMLAGVEKGLQFWYTRKPKSDNWWLNQIGPQLQFERILVLTEHDLPPDIMTTGLTYFMNLSPGSGGLKATGENLVWFAGEYLTHGLLTRNEAEIRSALEIIQGTIVITDTEGIQVDYSFHQHGSQLYNGGYGLGFLSDSAMWASYVAGTRFAFAPEKVDILSTYCLDGNRWMMRGPLFDYGANGRGLVRGGPTSKKEKTDSTAKVPLPGEYCDQLAQINPAKKAEFEALKAMIRGEGKPYTILGNKQFWRSDFMVEQTKDVYFSVKMNSSRTVGIEVINGENPKGYWLPFGLTYIAPLGIEYKDIFPVWDWAHLPGVTSPTAVYELKNNFKQPNTFVGGVSDGTHGACAMKLDIESPGESLHAQKAWFFFGDEIVALGAGISSTLGDPVDTTLNQTLLKGPVVADGKTLDEGTHDVKSVSWILHNGIGYLFPAKSDVVVNNTTQNGSWQSISSSESPAPVSEKVFSLWVNHGVKPTAGTYSYVVVPGADKKKLAQVAEKIPVQILSNTTDIQAVRNDPLGISQAIFYTPGKVTLKPGLDLQVDQPCMIMVTETKGAAKVALASPMSGVPIHVSLGSQVIPFDLPADNMEGSSQTKDAQL